MQLVSWALGTGNTISTVNERKAKHMLHVLCNYGFNPLYFGDIQRSVEKLNLSPKHPLNLKIQHILAEHPDLKNHVKPNVTLTSRPHTMPIINGDVLNVNNTLSTVKLIIKNEGQKFKKIIVREFDDELMALIAEHCPQVESLILNTGYMPCMSFSDKGLESIATLKNLKTLHIRSPLSIDITYEGFAKFLKTPALQKNLKELNIYLELDDKFLTPLAEYKSLTSLVLQCYSLTSKGLYTLFCSTNLNAVLEHLKVGIYSFSYDEKCTIDDAILGALTNFKCLKEINLGKAWNVTDPMVCKFLESHKDATKLTLTELPISDNVEAKIEGMSNLKLLNLSDCSQMWYYNFLNNKPTITHLDLTKAYKLYGDSVEKISKLPQLSFLNLSNSDLGRFDFFCQSMDMQNHLKELHLCNAYISSGSLTNIIHLKAMTFLRVEKCTGFNDDVMKAIAKSPLQTQLTTLQLNEVYISKNSLEDLAKMANVTGWLLSRLFAFTDEARESFFDLPNVQSNSKILVVNRFPFPKKIVDKLKDYSALERLGIINHYGDPQPFYDLQKNAASPLDLIFWLGPDNDGVVYRFFDGAPF